MKKIARTLCRGFRGNPCPSALRSKMMPACLFQSLLFLACHIANAGADEKTVYFDDVPTGFRRMEVLDDGSRLFLGAGREWIIFGPDGEVIDRLPMADHPNDLVALPDGGFIGFHSGRHGYVSRLRSDGSLLKKLAEKGGALHQLRYDMTGWTSPTGGASDIGRQLVFALDISTAPKEKPSPQWSRIAVVDFRGKYVRDIARYNNESGRGPLSGLRTWYDDIEVDPARQRVYVTARRFKKLRAFTYRGKALDEVPGIKGIAVLPDGRVAVGSPEDDGVLIYHPGAFDLKAPDLPGADLDDESDDESDDEMADDEGDGKPAEFEFELDPKGGPLQELAVEGVVDLETDSAGRLYATVESRDLFFVRWSPDLKTKESVGPRYVRARVTFPFEKALRLGKPVEFRVEVDRSQGSEEDRLKNRSPRLWQVFVRPVREGGLGWQKVPAQNQDGTLSASFPRLSGICDVAVYYGDGVQDRASPEGDLWFQKSFVLVPGEAAGESVSVISADARSAWRQGESVPFQVVIRSEKDQTRSVKLRLFSKRVPLAEAQVSCRGVAAFALAPEVTRHLLPGEYRLAPESAGCDSYPLSFTVAASGHDSLMQRILYHEFGTRTKTYLRDNTEHLGHLRSHLRTVAALGFTRETGRQLGKMSSAGPYGWRPDALAPELKASSFAAPEHYRQPGRQMEHYLDQAVRYGIYRDSQLLGHCDQVAIRDGRFEEHNPILQRAAQWMGRFPSFYGFNYNDELFFGAYAPPGRWGKEDTDWLEQTHKEKFPGRPRSDVLLHALDRMYRTFNQVARQANPKARCTATPMWQFPAVEGSYAPVVYAQMDESYSHYLTEGFQLPWYPAHSVDMLRRPAPAGSSLPNLPLMGVFDNSYRDPNGEKYMQYCMQVLGRGVQGVGVEHTLPFRDAQNSSAYRTANLIATMYAGLFARCPPANEAAVLYSYTQDVTERRVLHGTPHWESVYALFGAGLMSGIPMSIIYEEDISDGRLLRSGRPSWPMLFLVGQKEPLPKDVSKGIDAFVAAGGRVIIDKRSAGYPDAIRINADAHEPSIAMNAGYAADSAYVFGQKPLEGLAGEMRTAAASFRRFPVDTGDRWTGKNHGSFR